MESVWICKCCNGCDGQKGRRMSIRSWPFCTKFHIPALGNASCLLLLLLPLVVNGGRVELEQMSPCKVAVNGKIVDLEPLAKNDGRARQVYCKSTKFCVRSNFVKFTVMHIN